MARAADVSTTPADRIRSLNDHPVARERDCVLYWMTSARRTQSNFALQRAAEWSRELQRPLLVLEALRCGYRYASDRFHRFVLEGMADQARACAARGIVYHAYVEPEPGAGKGLLAALGARACVVVADDHPGFFLPRMLAAGAAQLDVRCEAVDGNGLLPIRAATREHLRAFSFRRFLQRELPHHLAVMPRSDPLEDLPGPTYEVPASIRRRWPAAGEALLARCDVAALPIDHTVAPVADRRGGSTAGHARLAEFLTGGLGRYASDRSQPDAQAASGLSPWLHFGQLGSHEVFRAIAQVQGWDPADLDDTASGAAGRWWGMDEHAEAFLDQLVTWRELAFHTSAFRPDDHTQYGSLPEWARRTLAAHARDRRDPQYTHAQFAAAQTHDELWNAAQRQLLREGRIPNYLRMLWGKKILEWSATPQQALATMLELNDRYALDGRDPNSYAGIFWVLGRYDRPWGPERPILGLIRPMSSANTARKLRVRGYVARYAG